MIKVYSRKNCQPCMLTKKWLDDNSIPYESVDVDTLRDLNFLRELGHSQLPVVYLGEYTHWSGYQPQKLKGLKNV